MEVLLQQHKHFWCKLFRLVRDHFCYILKQTKDKPLKSGTLSLWMNPSWCLSHCLRSNLNPFWTQNNIFTISLLQNFHLLKMSGKYNKKLLLILYLLICNFLVSFNVFFRLFFKFSGLEIFVSAVRCNQALLRCSVEVQKTNKSFNVDILHFLVEF